MSESKDKQPAKKKRFLSLPRYPGGSQAFKRFISDNLSYPEEALRQRIEGDVHVKFSVNDNGQITEATIIKSLGYGCDEEALRLVRMLRYEPVRNRGVRVTSSLRTRIPFRLGKDQPTVQIVYEAAAQAPPQAETPAEKNSTYSYTIRFSVPPSTKGE